MSGYFVWTSLKGKKYAENKTLLPKTTVKKHPMTAKIDCFIGSNKDVKTKLSKWILDVDQPDPLLRFEQLNLIEETESRKELSSDLSKAWKTRRDIILHKHTTSEKLTLVSSFLPRDDKALIRQMSNLNEKVKHRLEQLDEVDEETVRRTTNLTQQEFTAKINTLNEEIKKAWETEQRVKAFKIAIQCSKLLADTSVMHFYPSKFVIITGILDSFGDLVFDRIKFKSNGSKEKPFDSDAVSDMAKETCLNWLYKMASIRELLPRIYIEIALLKCYSYISKSEIEIVSERITKMIRGIGDPIVAVYLRAHLCRITSKLLTDRAKVEKLFRSNLSEFLEDYKQVFHPTIKKQYESQSLSLQEYYSIYLPAVDWLIYGSLNANVVNQYDERFLSELLKQCELKEHNEIIMYCILANFDSRVIINETSNILNIVQNAANDMELLPEILTKLGEHLASATEFDHLASENFTQIWWKLVSNMTSPVHFLQVLDPWMDFSCKHLSAQHVNIILRGTIRYMIKCGKPADEFSGQFQLVFKRMLKAMPDVEELLLMDAFMPLVELAQMPNARTLMAKTILSMFFDRYSQFAIEDHIVIASLMRLCCILHDSISALTVDDECKVCADLISKFIYAVQYPGNEEQQLNFYVDCRSAFLKLDVVLVGLVHTVNKLSVTVSEDNVWLQRACAAYCFITVPSLKCALTKLQLYLLSGQVALMNKCLGQAEANFKAFVSLIPDVPEFIYEDNQRKPTKIKLAGLIANFLSTLLVVPDNVDYEIKAYILNSLLETLESIHWRKTDDLYYMTMLKSLDLLTGLCQDEYAYHIDSVISNDSLYGSDDEYTKILNQHSTIIVQKLLVILKELGDGHETNKQYNLCTELLWRMVTKADLEQTHMFSLANKLWLLSEKLRDPQGKIERTIIKRLNRDARPVCKKLLQRFRESSNAQ